MILSHNSQSKQCSANHTWHANVKTVLPQEWSLFRYGVSRSWLLSSKQTQVVQQEIQRFRGNRRTISPVFRNLALTLLPRTRHFQMQEANRKLAAGRFVLYPESQAVQTSFIPFIWKTELSAYTPAGIEPLFTITLQLQRNSKWLLACTKTRVLAFCLLYFLGPLEKDY